MLEYGIIELMNDYLLSRLPMLSKADTIRLFTLISDSVVVSQLP